MFALGSYFDALVNRMKVYTALSLSLEAIKRPRSLLSPAVPLAGQIRCQMLGHASKRPPLEVLNHLLALIVDLLLTPFACFAITAVG